MIHLRPHSLRRTIMSQSSEVGNTPLIQMIHIRVLFRRHRLIAQTVKGKKGIQSRKTFKNKFSKQSNANHLQKPPLLRLSAVMKLSSPRLQSVVCAGNFNPACAPSSNWALKQLWNYFLFCPCLVDA